MSRLPFLRRPTSGPVGVKHLANGFLGILTRGPTPIEKCQANSLAISALDTKHGFPGLARYNLRHS